MVVTLVIFLFLAFSCQGQTPAQWNSLFKDVSPPTFVPDPCVTNVAALVGNFNSRAGYFASQALTNYLVALCDMGILSTNVFAIYPVESLSIAGDAINVIGTNYSVSWFDDMNINSNHTTLGVKGAGHGATGIDPFAVIPLTNLCICTWITSWLNNNFGTSLQPLDNTGNTSAGIQLLSPGRVGELSTSNFVYGELGSVVPQIPAYVQNITNVNFYSHTFCGVTRNGSNIVFIVGGQTYSYTTNVYSSDSGAINIRGEQFTGQQQAQILGLMMIAHDITSNQLVRISTNMAAFAAAKGR